MLRSRLGARGFGPLVRGLGAYGGAELATRIVRLLATIVIARRLAPGIVGEAALALSVFEIVRVLERTGTGQRIVAAASAELSATCNTAARVCWQWTLVLTALQVGAAVVLMLYFHRPVSGEILIVLSGVYLFMAAGHVPYHLAVREGLSASLARISASQTIADHVLTAALLLAWPSPWSLALPKLITAPLWLVMVRRARTWAPDPSAGTIPLAGMWRFSAKVLASEAMMALRTQGDNLIIAATMGTASLGTYYFAFNAGLGIISSLVSAFGLVAFPLLCRAGAGAERGQVLRRVMLGGALAFMPMVAVQALAAPWYVPLVFGRQWGFAAPLIAILCLAGLPLLASSMTTCWLRAEGKVGRDAASSALACVAALTGVYFGARTGSLRAAAAGLVIGQSLAALIYAIRTLGPALRRPASIEPANREHFA